MAEQPVKVSTSRLQLIHKVAIPVVLHSIHELKLLSHINFTSWFRCELFPFHFNKLVKILLQCSRSICMNAILPWYFSFLVELCYRKFWEKERLGCANNCLQINNLALCKQYHYILLIAYGSDNRRKFPFHHWMNNLQSINRELSRVWIRLQPYHNHRFRFLVLVGTEKGESALYKETNTRGRKFQLQPHGLPAAIEL